ncbi:hypothetical protein F4Y93_07845 [Candidatus Poribacteria bacterium]|nr:hypothetical protein [Candidatus Poribacteria bacterium]
MMRRHGARRILSTTPASGMGSKLKMPSASLIHAARSDASRSVSKWRWTLLGVMLSSSPGLNIVLLGISAVVLSVLTPKIDLSAPERRERYFRNPAQYTAEYRRIVKRLRHLRTFYGWLVGVIILNLF